MYEAEQPCEGLAVGPHNALTVDNFVVEDSERAQRRGREGKIDSVGILVRLGHGGLHHVLRGLGVAGIALSRWIFATIDPVGKRQCRVRSGVKHFTQTRTPFSRYRSIYLMSMH